MKNFEEAYLKRMFVSLPPKPVSPGGSANTILKAVTTEDVHVALSPRSHESMQGSSPPIDEDDFIDSQVEFVISSAPDQACEDMVVHLLSQLAASLSSKPSINESDATNKRSIELELADRRCGRQSPETSQTRRIRYPRVGRNKQGSLKHFAQLLRVVDLAHEAIVQSVPTTKRDVFYKDVSLFKRQAVVDLLVDDLAATLSVTRGELNIRASAKGLFASSGFSIDLISGERLEGNGGEGSLVPVAEEIARFVIKEDVAWVLIVEKEAVFQTLSRSNFPTHGLLLAPGLMITGKGYPDLATRQLVTTLNSHLPANIPILALVDCDPYGIEIASVYKFGSSLMKHENESLAAKRVEILGIWITELASFGVDKDRLLPFTSHDERKALSLLRRAYLPEGWRKMLVHMVHGRKKAEIEILSEMSLDFCSLHMGADDKPEGYQQSESGLLTYLIAKINRILRSGQDFADQWND